MKISKGGSMGQPTHACGLRRRLLLQRGFAGHRHRRVHSDSLRGIFGTVEVSGSNPKIAVSQRARVEHEAPTAAPTGLTRASTTSARSPGDQGIPPGSAPPVFSWGGALSKGYRGERERERQPT